MSRRTRGTILIGVASLVVGGLVLFSTIQDRQVTTAMEEAEAEIHLRYAGIDVEELKLSYALAGVEAWDAPEPELGSDGASEPASTAEDWLPGLPRMEHSSLRSLTFDEEAMRATYTVRAASTESCVTVLVAPPNETVSTDSGQCR